MARSLHPRGHVGRASPSEGRIPGIEPDSLVVVEQRSREFALVFPDEGPAWRERTRPWDGADATVKKSMARSKGMTSSVTGPTVESPLSLCLEPEQRAVVGPLDDIDRDRFATGLDRFVVDAEDEVATPGHDALADPVVLGLGRGCAVGAQDDDRREESRKDGPAGVTPTCSGTWIGPPPASNAGLDRVFRPDQPPSPGSSSR